MSWQTKAMYIFQLCIVIVVALIGILAVSVPMSALKRLLAGADIGLVIVDIAGIALYARYVHKGI